MADNSCEKKVYKASANREYPKTVITAVSNDPLVELLIKTGIIYGVKFVSKVGPTYLQLDNFEIENHKPAETSAHGITFEMDEFWNGYNFRYKDVLALLQEFYDELNEDLSNSKELLADDRFKDLHYTVTKFAYQIGEANGFNVQDYREATGRELRPPRRDKNKKVDRPDTPRNDKGRSKLNRK